MKGSIPSFERASGHSVTMTVLGNRPCWAIKEGTFGGLILLGPDALNDRAASGKVEAGTITPAFKSCIGLAVRGRQEARHQHRRCAQEGAARGEIDRLQHRTERRAFSKVVVDVGIADELRPKMANARGGPVGTGVLGGDVEIGIHQIAELMPIAGIDIVGDLPAELNKTIIYATGLTTMVKQPEAAKALAAFFALVQRRRSAKNAPDPVR